MSNTNSCQSEKIEIVISELGLTFLFAWIESNFKDVVTNVWFRELATLLTSYKVGFT